VIHAHPAKSAAARGVNHGVGRWFVCRFRPFRGRGFPHSLRRSAVAAGYDQPEATYYEATADAAPTQAPIGIIMDFPEERYIPLVATAEETLSASDDALELAFHPDNFLASETETAAVIAAGLASLSETTGSVDVAERLEIACLDGEEDR
jgi:hypothetical protein